MQFSFGVLFCLLAPVSGLAVGKVHHVPRAPSRSESALPSASVSGHRVVGLAAAVPTPISNSVKVDQELVENLWKSVRCDQYSINDATVAMADRWYSAGATGAWHAMLREWKDSSTEKNLGFTDFVGHFFNRTEIGNCQNINSVSCSSTLQCGDSSYPAGYLILNALSGIHQLHSQMYNALDTAMLEILGKIGTFSTTFAPQSDDTALILAIFDALTLMMGFTVSASFSVVEKGIAQVASSAKSSKVLGKQPLNPRPKGDSDADSAGGYQIGVPGGSRDPPPNTSRQPLDFPSDTVEKTQKAMTGSPMEFDAKAYANDMVYQLYTITAGFTRNNAPQKHDKLDAQSSLSSAVTDIFTGWKNLESSYIEKIFSGQDESLVSLEDLMKEGKMNLLPKILDSSKMAASAKAVIYGQLMPIAWKTASDWKGSFPRIVQTDISCDNKASKLGPIDDYGLMTEANSLGTRACWRDKLVFLVNALEWDSHAPKPLSALPGANREELSGGRWGGITVDDIVASAMTGFENAGYKNGYKSPSVDGILRDPKKEDYGKHVRYPGFFNIPVCTNLESTKIHLLEKGGQENKSEYWPCAEPEDVNTQGTTIHVNKGWITANKTTPVCGQYTVADVGGTEDPSITLYGRFEGSNHADEFVKPSCAITFSWPKSWADIYYGEDNCMYGGHDEQILAADGNHACCVDTDSTDLVANPYYFAGVCEK